MKKISTTILILLAALMLVACGDGKKENFKVTVESLTPARSSVHIVLNIEDEESVIVKDSIEAKLYYKDSLVSTTPATIVKDEEDGVILESYIEIKSLSVGEEYRVEILLTANKKSHKVYTNTFETSIVGSSKENPILIKTKEDFMNINNDSTAYYRLENDIDFEGEYLPSMFQTIVFRGHLDGNNKTVKNYLFNQRKSYLGIFGRNNGTIENLTLEGGKVELKYSSQYISLLVARNSGIIRNVHVKDANIDIDFVYTGTIYMGGIVGYGEINSELRDSKVTNLNINIKASERRTEFNIGGLTGRLVGAQIFNSTADVKINIVNGDSSYIGGAVGFITHSNNLRAKLTQVIANLDITIETKVKSILILNNKEEVIVGNIGGLVGKSIMATINKSSGTNKTILTGATNNATQQSNQDYFSIGGLAGTLVSGNILFETLSELDVTVKGQNEADNFKGFENLYIGGIAGESFNSEITKAFSKDFKATVENEDLPSRVHPLFGYGEEGGDYNGSIINHYTDTYENESLRVDGEIKEVTSIPTTILNQDYYTTEFMKDLVTP